MQVQAMHGRQQHEEAERGAVGPQVAGRARLLPREHLAGEEHDRQQARGEEVRARRP